MSLGPIWQDLRLADGATLLNAALGIIAAVAVLRGDPTLAFLLAFLAIIVDGADGAIARLGGGGGPLGATIDTLADVVTFVAVPGIAIIAVLDTQPLGIAAGIVYVCAGLLRLARFQNLPDGLYFHGLSTPGGALVIGTVAIMVPTVAAVVTASAVASALMLMRRPLPKLRGALGIAGVLIILTNLAVHWAMPDWRLYALAAQAAFVVAYVVGGPAYLKAQGKLAGDHGQA